MEKEPQISSENTPVKGIVTARKCECCGHHEIGIVTERNIYIPLKPGMMIEIIQSGEIKSE